ncbi:DUF4872 domain-containing protein [Cryobacterium sp. TMS1-13-1]|uniref:DUF4872 domain-containing protein n=1 Tax=Cryobacterium sp. TMS1-13-1 TaxID=1259220 RepID=UPI00106D9007|nr:DUF4872 domain-containing protein [Cryobacterium sp. TMS1-13-1]TFD19195.1 DUF4872 domain-containing protein [Cryobacterium sp. TMS1-13-1]
MKLTRRTEWPTPYLRGSHCFSTMLANVFADTEFDIGEELAYVIGGGLSFLFYRENDTYYVNSRIHDLEHFFARHTGSRVDFVSHSTADEMLRVAGEWAVAGFLPYVYCEARELESFRRVLPWGQVHPFGEHALPIRSIAADGSLMCNDYLWSELFSVSRDNIDAASSMPSDGLLSMAAPARRFAVGRIVPPDQVPDMREVLAVSLEETAELFLTPTNNTQGQRALKAFERELASMPEIVPHDRMRTELLSMATTLEKIGTGGGAGRHLFARGLRVSADRWEIPELRTVAGRYASLGGRWRSLARLMHRHSQLVDPTLGWRELVLTVRNIRRSEVEAVSELLDVSSSILGGRS